MDFLNIVGALLLTGILLLIIKAIIDSIKMVLLVLLALLVLVYFFGISLSEVTSWIYSQEWLRSLAHTLLKTLLFSLQSS